MTMDPRLAERRRVVAEDRAQRTVQRLLQFLSAIGLVGLIAWFMLSPYMSASEVAVTGADMAAVDAILAEHSVVPGQPLILIRPGAVTAALREDPWVAEAAVDLQWPDRVEVTVTERVPRAWVEGADGWTRRDESGAPVPSPVEPDNELGWVHLPEFDGSSVEVRGAIEFLMALPEEMARSTSIRMEEGELWGSVDGWTVRLGRADEMKEKALSLVTLLEQDLEEGSMLVLIAPTHPSVLPPGSATDEGQAAEGEENGAEEENQEEGNGE